MTALTPAPSAAPRVVGAHTAPTVAALAKALREEEALLRDLIVVLERQREAIARDDLQALDDSVFGTHRVLLTLGEARRRRVALNHHLGEADDLSMEALQDAFGGAPPLEIQAAIDALARTGERLRREVELNQRVLRTAVEAGDQLVRALCGAVPPGATYGPESPRASDSTMLDRRV
jgi:hypothetical protein